MKKLTNKIKESIKNWLIGKELDDLKIRLQQQTNALDNYKNLFSNLGISADVHLSEHHYSPSWAVISLQGEKQDYIKFVNLGASDIRAIGNFLRQFDRNNVSVDVPHCMLKNEILKFY